MLGDSSQGALDQLAGGGAPGADVGGEPAEGARLGRWHGADGTEAVVRAG